MSPLGDTTVRCDACNRMLRNARERSMGMCDPCADGALWDAHCTSCGGSLASRGEREYLMCDECAQDHLDQHRLAVERDER